MSNSENSKKSNLSSYAKFSALGIQMAAIIAIFTYLGTYLDNKNPGKTPWWTIILALFGVFSALALVIREVLRMNKENE